MAPNLLGCVMLNDQKAPPTLGVNYGVELVGQVFPSDFDLDVVRDREKTGLFLAYVGGPVPRGEFRPGIPGTFDDVGHGNDTGDADLRDDDPRPNGSVYDLDAPGFERSSADAMGLPAGSLGFSRQRFIEFTRFGRVRCANNFRWFARTTGRKIGGVGSTDWECFSRPGVPSDNSAGPGSTDLNIGP